MLRPPPMPAAGIRRFWQSATANTWASFFTRSLGTFLLLPLVLHRLPIEDFNVWALFSTLAGLQLLVDMGFCVTFVRAIAVSLAGAESHEAFKRHAPAITGKNSNWELLVRVVGFMRFVYAGLGWSYLALIGVVGALVLIRPISLTGQPGHAWAAWLVLLISGCVTLRTNYLGLLLQGLNEIALLRRWEAVTTLCSSLSGCVVLYFNGSLLALVLSTQLWVLVGVARNYWLCRKVMDGRFATLPPARNDKQLFRVLWPPTWRSGVGVLMSFGLIQATGLLQAQFMSAASSASYLLCLRIIQQISAFSQAPFYTKLAVLPRMRAENRIGELVEVAGRGMRLSLWAYVAGFAAAGFLGADLLRFLGSKVEFPPMGVFVLFGALYGIERYAAMYLNLYNITNDVITHVANGVTGLLCVMFVLLLWPYAGDMALPMGLLAGYASFYAWFPVRRAYRAFGMKFWEFELRNGFGPLLFFIFSAVLLWGFSGR